MDGGNNEQGPAAAPTCAVCRYRRRQCNATCILASYFPIHRTQEFHWVRMVFGISKLTQIVSSVGVNERATAVETLIIEARLKLHYPVYGSLGLVQRLQADVIDAQNELAAVNQQLSFLRGDHDTDRPPAQHGAGPSNSDLKGKKNM